MNKKNQTPTQNRILMKLAKMDAIVAFCSFLLQSFNYHLSLCTITFNDRACLDNETVITFHDRWWLQCLGSLFIWCFFLTTLTGTVLLFLYNKQITGLH